MALVNERSPLTALPSLDIFASPPIQDTYSKTYIKKYRPIAHLNSSRQIEINFQTSFDEYSRLCESTLYFKGHVELEKTTGTIAKTDWSKVSICDNFQDALISDFGLSIGDVETSTALQNYHYSSYIQTLLTSDDQDLKTHLKMKYFHADDLAGSKRDALNEKRQKLIENKSGDATKGNSIELIGVPNHDLFRQPRDLIGGLKITIKLTLNKPEFIFMTSDATLRPKFVFEAIELRVLHFKAKPEIVEAHNIALGVGLVKIPIKRIELRSITLDTGITTRSVDHAMIGQKPNLIAVGFVNNKDKSGDFTKNGYYFDHHNCNQITCFVNGLPHPIEGYKCDFANNVYATELFEFYRTIGHLNNNKARTLITPEKFKNGYTLWLFNLSQDYSLGYNSSGYVNLPEAGVLRFEFQFSQALTEAVDALIYCEFDNQISLGTERKAILDYR